MSVTTADRASFNIRSLDANEAYCKPRQTPRLRESSKDAI
jgi:hypothetical protein